MTEERGIDRRTFVHRAGALGALTASGGLTALLSACGGDDDAGGCARPRLERRSVAAERSSPPSTSP